MSFSSYRNEEDNVLQVNDLAGNHTASDAELLMGFTSIIQNSCQPLCMAWLEDELSINNSRLGKVLLEL